MTAFAKLLAIVIIGYAYSQAFENIFHGQVLHDMENVSSYLRFAIQGAIFVVMAFFVYRVKSTNTDM